MCIYIYLWALEGLPVWATIRRGIIFQGNEVSEASNASGCSQALGPVKATCKNRRSLSSLEALNFKGLGSGLEV